jgi:nucleoside-diphosphate-sugar epimerase
MGFDTGFFGNCLTNVDYLPERKLDEQYFGDIRNFPADLLKDVEMVINLAAISNDPMGNRFEKVTMDVNYHACIKLAKQAKAMGVKRFVFASSCSVYGSVRGEAREDSNVNPLTAYARSKVYAERDLRPLADKDFTITCLRFATACGMSSRLRLDLVLNDFVACALTTKKITILSDGTPWRPLINVKDMALAIEWALIRPLSLGAFLALNTGDNRWNYQVKQLAEAVAFLIPDIKISINADAPADKRSYKVDFGLYKIVAPTHQPQYDLLATITELKEGLLDMNFSNPNFRESTWMRLKALTHLQNKHQLSEDVRWSISERLETSIV